MRNNTARPNLEPRPERLELEELLDRRISRRSLLRGFGKVATVGASVLAADTLAGEYLWGGTNPEIKTLATGERKGFESSATLVIGGFGVSDTTNLATSVAPVLEQYGSIAHLEYSSNGIHMGDLVDSAKDYIDKNNIKNLRIYGHSMGGMVAVALAANIAKDVELSALLLDCSPASYEDVRSQDRAGTWLLHTTDELSLHFGPLTRLGMEVMRPIAKGDDDYFRICERAINKLSDGSCSNKLIQAQASFIRTFNPADYSGAFPDSMPILRLRPRDFNEDRTINNETSLPRWREGLNHDIVDVAVTNGGHANPVQRPQEYATAFTAVAKAYAFDSTTA